MDDGVCELLYDAHRFLLKYGDAVAYWALYVYHTAFQFLPRDTALYRAYEGVVRSSVRVVRGARRKWSPLLSEIGFVNR